MFRFRTAVAVTALTITTLAPAPPAGALPDWIDHTSSWTNEKAKAPRVVDLRYGAHKKFDRVVLEIDGKIPSGTARYRKRFRYDGSGEKVPIKGRSGIALVLSPAYAHDDEGGNVYEGPRIARPRFETLKALAFTGDFEGHVSFGLALRHRAPYRVFRLHDPQRLVIDVQHR
ncbi:hypothetical protein [Nocardioides sp.]|uniref:AMIN-like domain-containing (lipo)protein n=1 Tax=Nocardioides sp. TaxID=35761 RepID=UPI00356B0358